MQTKKEWGGGELNEWLLHISVHTDTPLPVVIVVPGLSWIN